MQRHFIMPVLAVLSLAACGDTGGGNQADGARMIQLAQDLNARGDHASAAMMFERAAATSGDSRKTNMMLGKALLDANEPGRAAAAYRKALNAGPQDGEALLGLGTAQLRADQVEAAARTLAVAAPKVRSATAYNRLGTAMILSGDANGAGSAFAEAAKIEPANLDTQSNLALAQAISGQSEPAIAGLRAVTASPRAERRHFHNLMIVLVLAGQDAAAAAVPIPDYSAKERTAFLAEARKVRTITGVGARARAIGLLAGR